ncbi:MAG: DMT family transporter [Actinobacteria bacterium]|nr:DMT family transporter [Actinomycetota bacterium]
MEASGRHVTQRNGWVWCATAAVLFGAATPATKLVVDHVGAVTLAGLLYLGAALAVAPFALREQRSVGTLNQRARLLLAVGFGGGLAPVLLVLALDRTPAGTVSLFLNLELVATAFIARVFLQEHIGRRSGLGIVIVVIGGVILAGTAEAGLAVGALLVVATCVCWGIDNAITASLDSYSPSQITLAKGVVAGSVNLILGLALDGAPVAAFVLASLGIGVLGYGISITMWITGARLVGAARGQVIFALAPFIGAVLAWPVNGDRITGTTAVAFTVSLVGVVVVATSRHEHDHTHQPIEHTHAIDPSDPHHRGEAIEIIAGTQHRHLFLTHEHVHLPDIHHRHEHPAV